ncbi:amidase family protein [Burkholderia pyrrocinia]|uniref:amidase family protein n=1 Tax=Burkholderia pyrrocinia TaxID=60550 RepID=UPI001FB22CF3|nr:amidase family protein [Burkholderia pyrrocinia]UOB55247.1 amidase family protein [Burkholderia pyrrocinia]
MNKELWRLSATEVVANLTQCECLAQEVVASCLARLDAVNPQTNAVVDVLADDAMRAAADADARIARGARVGPLHGVPVTVKVNVDMTGRATSNGVAAYRDVVAVADSPVVANLRKAGAIIIGRTNTPAFSLRWFTDNELYGRTLNPWVPGLTSGGSSGGAAVAVATGVGAIAHGNDLGGSIRYPAYACGVAGLRPSQGRVPAFNPSQAHERTPAVQLASVQGPLARTVADLRLALRALAAPDLNDPWWVPVPLSADAGPTRVALCRQMDGIEADPAVLDALDFAAGCLDAAGYSVVHATPPALREAADLWLALTTAEMEAGMGGAIDAYGDDAVRAAYASMMHLAKPLDTVGYMNALSRRSSVLRHWQVFFARHPLLLMPVSWQRPFPIDADRRGDDAMRRILDAQSPMLATAILGLPGLSVPVGAVDGLPVGVQLVAGRFQEGRCLAAGEVIEARCGVTTPIDPRRGPLH